MFIEARKDKIVYGTKITETSGNWKYWKFYIDNNGFGKVYQISETHDSGMEHDAEKAFRRFTGKMSWLWDTKLGRLLVLI
ncbi:hypothetical protein LCGC14_1238640 [marine sediment metagenome]|uniref:Uncharacterized protein n=1 Tax=marine sediment metagenome TaxID=412755 RepID=A0A0F9L6N1_9ZZZZ|nr:hypothetical protein [Pricia sp.]